MPPDEPIDRFLKLLDNVTPTGSGYSARCPAHDDQKNSLSVAVGAKGQVLMKCHAGCAHTDVVAKLGLQEKDLFVHRHEKIRVIGKKVVATYRYRDLNGDILYEVVRYDTKEFIQRRPDPTKKGKFVYNLKGVQKVLYNLPEVAQAVAAGKDIFICEGEKDSDNLMALNLVATTNAAGAASKWLPEYNEALKGANVVIIPDNDEPGRKHATNVAQSLTGIANSVKVLELPNIPPKGDVSDFLEQGGTKEQLLELAAKCDPWISDVESSDEQSTFDQTPWTDISNANRFVRMHGSYIRYCHDQKTWYYWDGHRWTTDNKGEIMRLAAQTATAVYIECGSVDPGDTSEAAKWGRQTASRGRMQSMIALAQSDPSIGITSDQFDVDDWALNTLSGTIDLRTGQLRPHNKEDHITKLAPVEFDPQAASDAWDEFLKMILPDEDLRNYVQRAVGYSITGDTGKEVLFVAVGPPASGKTTFIETIGGALGDYAATASIKTFTKNNNAANGANSDIARLAGKRFVRGSEIDKGDELSESVVKQITGGDTLTARFLYGDFFEFTPKLKLWIATNDRPRARDDDDAMWRRIRQIPFSVSIPEDRRDPEVKRQLTDLVKTGPAVLSWAVTGALEYQKKGLKEPEAVSNATKEYREEMDPFKDFVSDCCVLDSRARVSNTELWAAYVKWCQENGQKYPISRNSFKQRLEKLGGVQFRDRNHRYWKGIGLIEDPATTYASTSKKQLF